MLGESRDTGHQIGLAEFQGLEGLVGAREGQRASMWVSLGNKAILRVRSTR